MNSNLDNAENFARMWRKSRADAGKSQEYCAKALGVSKKTIQNWEEGTSCPTQLKGLEWFQVLGLNPLPYYLELLFPDRFSTDIAPDDEQIKRELIRFIENTTPEIRAKLFYFLCGNHGSSVIAILELITAHLRMPLENRIQIANVTLNAYKLAEKIGNVQDASVDVDKEILMKSINQAFAAVVNHEKGYSIIEKEGD